MIALLLADLSNIGVALISGGASFSLALAVAIVSWTRKPTTHVTGDVTATQPEVTRRLDSHDVEIGEIWKTIRTENTAMRAELTDVKCSLGRIEGRLGTLPVTPIT